MAFILTIAEDQAPPAVKQMYAEELQNKGYIPNYSRVFSHRPQVMEAWEMLAGSVRAQMDLRRYELITLAAARALRSSYCSLAHGTVLRNQLFSPEKLADIATDYRSADLTPAEVAMMAFAEQLVWDATAITQQDIYDLRAHGFSDAEIFDIAATAAMRCFFSKMLDALGAEPDEVFLGLEENLRQVLAVGRVFPRSAETS
jgi:uncharacterized peroxidase-related enzyme